jgi:nucleoside-diphosphate-sugar epimerase
MNVSTVLVTGATGLVGSRLLPRLIADGHDCRVLLRQDQSVPAGATTVRGDLNDPSTLPTAVRGVEAVVHLAALFRTGDEAAIWKVNLDGTRNLLEAVTAHASAARFVMASTGNVYNHDQPRPGLESDTCNPTAAYPASKLAAEVLLRDSGLTWSVLRLPFVYGEGDGHLASMPALASRFGLHPAHTYSVAHHRDVAIAVRLALSGALDGRVANVTDDAPVTVFDMVRLVGAPIDGSAEPLANPWAGRMDSSLLRGLGFRPSIATIWEASAHGIL